MLDETFWPAATAVFLDNDLQEYASPIIPLRQNIQDSDYAFISKSGLYVYMYINQRNIIFGVVAIHV